MRAFVVGLMATLILLTTSARAQQCPPGKVCVDREDMTVFVSALREKKCLIETQPTITADPIAIVIDKQGRVYGTGSDPHPFQLQMRWCNYNLTATGQTKILAAQRVEPEYGFRFRLKAALGLLGTELLAGEKVQNTVDGGALIEPFYYRFVNVNGYVGVRSVGAGIGFDLTKNFGLALGYALTWGGWRSNPFAGAYFAFW